MNTILRGSLGRILMIVLLAHGMAGCAWWSRKPEPWRSNLSERDNIKRCARFFADADQRIEDAGVADAQYARLDGFPYLRVDRFLASFRYELADGERFTAWLRRAQALDEDARSVEFANLSEKHRSALQQRFQQTDLVALTKYCGDQLMSWDMNERDRRRQVLEAAEVDHGYSQYAQTLGLYPLTRYAYELSNKQWQKDLKANFNNTAILPNHVKLIHYTPEVSEHTNDQNTQPWKRDPLGIPQLTTTQWQVLVEQHAPVWAVQTRDDADKIGVPAMRKRQLAAFDYEAATVFTQPSYTRLGKEILLQINYAVWFSERPLLHKTDPHGGRLDGLMWRVTLDQEGKPLLYDAVNASGQFHVLFPTQRLQVRAKLEDEQAVVMPQMANNPEARPVLTLTAGGHQLIGLTFTNQLLSGKTYTLANYRSLRILPQLDGGTHSLFNNQGLVEGTERGVGILLWASGVPAPGAMRQMGNHITSMISKRHFDDANLLTHFFVRKEGSD